jgi:ATP-dependent Clp protease ATP-binding subunit ClpC
MINNLSKRLDEMNIHIKVDEKAMDILADAGFDPVYGARPLQREIRRRIEDKLSEELLKGTIKKSDTILISADDNELIFSNDK